MEPRNGLVTVERRQWGLSERKPTSSSRAGYCLESVGHLQWSTGREEKGLRKDARECFWTLQVNPKVFETTNSWGQLSSPQPRAYSGGQADHGAL